MDLVKYFDGKHTIMYILICYAKIKGQVICRVGVYHNQRSSVKNVDNIFRLNGTWEKTKSSDCNKWYICDNIWYFIFLNQVG